jgi:outer membrane protein assembly factor BamB
MQMILIHPKNTKNPAKSQKDGLLGLFGVLFLLLGTSGVSLLARTTNPHSLQRGKGLFSVFRDEENSRRLLQARSLLAKEHWNAGIETLLQILRSASPSAVLKEPGRGYRGLLTSARELLTSLPPKAQRIYETRIKGQAELLLHRARKGKNLNSLKELSKRFPGTHFAIEAQLQIADILLEAGNIPAAWNTFSKIPASATSGTAGKLLCRKLLGLPLHSESLPPGNYFWKGGKLTKDALSQELQALQALPQPGNPWPEFGGNAEGNGIPGPPVSPQSLFWERRIPTLSIYNWGINPVSDGRRVLLSTGTGLHCFHLMTGELEWSFDGPLHFEGRPSDFLGGLSPHQIHVAAVKNNIVVAAIQVPVIPDIAKENTEFNGIPVMRRLPVRRLFGFNLETGRVLWSHWSEKGIHRKGENQALDVSAPPLIVGDTIYVATHKQLGTIAYYVSAFDLNSGKLKWKSLICSSQIEVNMFGNASWEHPGAPLACSDGTLFGTTNLGVAFSIEAQDGAIRWLRPYEIIPIPQAQMIPTAREVYWANNPPVISKDLVILTPTDSVWALALERKSGKLRWKAPYIASETRSGRSYPLRWLLGIRKNKVYFSGDCFASIPLAPMGLSLDRRTEARVLASGLSLGIRNSGDLSEEPRPVLTQTHLLFSSRGLGLRRLRLNGKADDRGVRNRQEGKYGNLCSSGGVLISARPLYQRRLLVLRGFFSFQSLLGRARNDFRENPKDLGAAFRLAELMAATPDGSSRTREAAISAYRFVLHLLKAGGKSLNSPLGLRTKRGLFRLLLDSGQEELTRSPESGKKHLFEALGIGISLPRTERTSSQLLGLCEILLSEESLEPSLKTQVYSLLEGPLANIPHAFSRFGTLPGGLFALLTRIQDSPKSETKAKEQMLLLQRILEEFGTTRIGGLPSRKFVISEMKKRMNHFGKRVYEILEKRAQEEFARAGSKRKALKRILHSYPLSEVAGSAIVSLAKASANKGDLKGVLEAWVLSENRSSSQPDSILLPLASVAEKWGNLPLSRAAWLRLSDRARMSLRPLPNFERFPPKIEPLLNGVPETLLLDEYWDQRRGRSGDLTTSLLTPVQVRGFPESRPLPLLFIHSERYELLAFPPDPKTLNYHLDKAGYRIPFEPSIRPLTASIHGNVLVLPERGRVRGVSIASGKVLWEYDKQASGIQEMEGEEVLLSGPLNGGIYLVVSGDPGSKENSLILHGLEPLTGTRVFRQPVPGNVIPELKNGYFFTLSAEQVSSHRIKPTHLRILDPWAGKMSAPLVFDGQELPLLQPPRPRNIVITDREIFALTLSPGRRFRKGLFALNRKGDRQWSAHPLRLGSADTFIVSGEKVLLQSDFGRKRPASILPLLRETGKRGTRIQLGVRAFSPQTDLSGSILLPGSPVIYLSQHSSGTALTLVQTKQGLASWEVPLPSPPADLERDLQGGVPFFGKDFVLLAWERSRGSRGRLHLVAFDQSSGRIVRRILLRKSSFVDLEVWNGALVGHSWRETWVRGKKWPKENKAEKGKGK